MKATRQILDLLVALSHGPQHGYALMQRIEQQHDLEYKPSPGVVYSNLQRLVDWGWAEETKAPTNREDPRRKFYKLVGPGVVALKTHIEAEQQRLDLARQALGRVSA